MTKEADTFKIVIAAFAFIIAFYSLIAKEKKVPDMASSIYYFIFLLFVALVPYLILIILRSIFPNALEQYKTIAAFYLIPGLFLFIFYIIVKDFNKYFYFRDDFGFKNIPIIKWIRYKAGKHRHEDSTGSYEFDHAFYEKLAEKTPFIPDDKIKNILDHRGDFGTKSISILAEIPTRIEIDNTLTNMACFFIENKYYVQYISCIRHPLEFLLQIKKKWSLSGNHKNMNWSEASDRIVVIDAHTPHYGFSESMYLESTKQASEECLKILTASRSYAGIHSSVAKGFKRIISA